MKTTKAEQVVMDIILQQNREQSLLREQLLYLYATGSVIRYVRKVKEKA